MKKILSVILTICLMLSLVSVAAAADPCTEYKTEFYTVTLPEGTWYEKAGAEGLTYYYQNESYNATDGMIMFLAQDIDLGGVEVPESLMGSLYDSLIKGLTSSAVDGKVEQDDCRMAGRLSRYYAFNQAVGGSVYPVTGACVMIDGHVLAICYTYPGKMTDELKETVLGMCAAVKYAGDPSQMTEDEDQAQAQSDTLMIGSDHAGDGYITVRKKDVDKDCKVIVAYGDNNLEYDLNGEEEVVLPLQYGSGVYTIYLAVPADAEGEKEPGHEYQEFRISNYWERNNADVEKCYEILDVDELTAEIDDPYSCFLHPNCYVMYDDQSPWVVKAAELSYGLESDMEKFNVITAFICQNYLFDYIKSVTVGDSNILPDVEYCWTNQMGISQDLSAMACAMLRGQGIPAVLVYGSYHEEHVHCWVMARIDGRMVIFDPAASLNALSDKPMDYITIVPFMAY